MRHEVYRMGSGKSQNKQQQQVASRPVREFIPRTRSFSSCPAPMPAPTTHASSASSSTSTPVFPADQLRACIRPLLATTLRDVAYDHADPGRMKELSRGLAEVRPGLDSRLFRSPLPHRHTENQIPDAHTPPTRLQVHHHLHPHREQ